MKYVHVRRAVRAQNESEALKGLYCWQLQNNIEVLGQW